MSIKKLLGVGALAVVVAGVVVAVSAAPPDVVGGLSVYADATDPQEGSMRATYNVVNTAILEVETKNPTDDGLIISYSDSVNNARPGNLGYVRVKTSATSWDIQMSTENGGRLYLPGKISTGAGAGFDTACIGGTWHWLTGECSAPGGATITPKRDPGQYLKYDSAQAALPTAVASGNYRTNSGNRKEVLLSVGIGLAVSVMGEDTAKGGSFGTLTVRGAAAAGNSNAMAVIDSATLLATGKDTTVNSGSAADFGPLSFAVELGKNSTKFGTTENVGGILISDLDATQGFGSVPRWEYFFVNAGLPKTYYDMIGGNKPGEYSETFTFKLVTNF
jgi:hypothetical protein